MSGENQREHRERAEHDRREPLARHRVLHPIRHRLDVVDRDGGVDGVDLADNGGGHAPRGRRPSGRRGTAACRPTAGRRRCGRRCRARTASRCRRRRRSSSASWDRSRGACRSRLSGQKRCANFSSMIATGCAFGSMSKSVKKRPLTQRNLHRREIVGRRGALIDLQLLPGLRRPSLDVDRSPSHRRRERQRRHRAAHFHARHARDRVAELPEVLDGGVAIRELTPARARAASRSRSRD